MDGQNWLRALLGVRRFRHLRKTYQALHKRGVIKSTLFEVDFYGSRYSGDWSINVDNHVFFYGAYEKHVLFFMRDVLQRCKSRGTFVDVGANVGHHTVFMAGIADFVCAFEPYPLVRAKMYHKIRMNRLANVRVFPFGLGRLDGDLDFYPPGTSNLGTGSFVVRSEHVKNAMKLPVRRGDGVVEDEGIKAIRIIKIDVEGFEKEVLCGLRTTLHLHHPIVVMEMSREVDQDLFTAAELERLFPPQYDFFMFDAKRRRSGRRSRRFRGLQRATGAYRLVPLDLAVPDEQINVVACHAENRALID